MNPHSDLEIFLKNINQNIYWNSSCSTMMKKQQEMVSLACYVRTSIEDHWPGHWSLLEMFMARNELSTELWSWTQVQCKEQVNSIYVFLAKLGQMIDKTIIFVWNKWEPKYSTENGPWWCIPGLSFLGYCRNMFVQHGGPNGGRCCSLCRNEGLIVRDKS